MMLSVVALTALASERAIDHLSPPPLDRLADLSTEVVGQHGQLLRPFANSQNRWRLALEPSDLDPRFVDLLLAYEDRRFWRHGGVDTIALARAFWQLLSQGRVVSGGSTITMQLARLIEPRPRTLGAKLHQIWRAIQIERRLSKHQILTHYLNIAPYGGNLEGIRAAALAYFGRGVGHLPPAAAALLVALPQSPEARRPDRYPEAAKKARDRVLARAAKAGALSTEEAEAAIAQVLSAKRRPFPALAAHEANRLARSVQPGTIITTHIDAGLQARLETLARAHVKNIAPKASVAIIAAEVKTGRIRAHIGAPDPFDTTRHGPIDMTRALRSPGSVLKPFIYGLAFEAGIAHPNTLIDDRLTDFSGYAPRNFDNGFQGTVTMSEALSQSLNIPAVKVLEAVGPTRFLSRLARAGANPQLPDSTAPGLAVALGGMGISLKDNMGAYAALARGGEPVQLHSTGAGSALPRQGQLLGPIASWYVTDILTRTPPPEAGISGRIAYKTGTSYGYRDAWAIGFDGRHVIGVWVGRPDGTPIFGLSGRRSAAPVLFAGFARLNDGVTPLPGPPDGVRTAVTSELPVSMQHFGVRRGQSSQSANLVPLSISYPPTGAHLALGGTGESLALKAMGGKLPLTWFANGRPVSGNDRRRQAFWKPDGRGYSDLSVIDAAGQAARVRVFLE